ncbi:hypothetical protein JB92DRAFT_1462330 [Gautieria morchelliformis]|nr:hypothetical protein JB92DRAFT_1462330 [Gautieria morchelliformis]
MHPLHSPDFIHVVSLKGTLLYVAPAVTRVLGYDAAELVGKSIARLCHPADVVPLMRKLKDASSTLAHNVPPHPAHIPGHPHPIILLPPSPPPPKSISLLFRAAHKTRGGYVWLEARGRLHVEPGKGRKAVVLVGRRVGVGKLGWGVVDSVGEGLSDGSVGMDQRPECWGLVSPSGIILSASPGGAQMLGYTHAPCGSARLTGPALDAARAVLVGHSLSALLLPSDVRRVGEVLAGAACASTRMERDEVRRVRCYMQRWGAVRAQNARTVHAEGLESANGDRQRQGGGDVQRDGTGDVSVSGMGAGAGVAAPRPIPVELRFIAQPRDREQGVMSEEEARRAPAVPGKVVFQMLLLGEGVAGADAGVDTHGGQTSLRSSPSAALPSRSTDSPQHTHTRSRTPRPSRGNIFAELDTLSLPPSPASFPSSPASPFSASASASASTSLPSPTTAPSETSWQYSLTRLRFENERMRGEVARLERMQSVPGTRGRGAHLRGRAGAERLTTTTTTTTTRRSYGRRRGGDAGASSRGTAAGRAEESGFGAGGGRDAHAQIMSCMPNIPHKRTREEMMEELPEVTRPP